MCRVCSVLSWEKFVSHVCCDIYQSHWHWPSSISQNIFLYFSEYFRIFSGCVGKLLHLCNHDDVTKWVKSKHVILGIVQINRRLNNKIWDIWSSLSTRSDLKSEIFSKKWVWVCDDRCRSVTWPRSGYYQHWHCSSSYWSSSSTSPGHHRDDEEGKSWNFRFPI